MMNKKSKKLITYISMAIFMFALTLNLRLAVDDTFTLGSELAYGSGGHTGTLTWNKCELTSKEIKITSFKWELNGEVHWSPTSPGAAASGGVISKEITVKEITWGSEYKCVGLGADCSQVICYGSGA